VTEEHHDHQDREPVAYSVTAVIGWIAATLIFYVVSIGPAVFVHDNVPGMRSAIEAFYAPVLFLVEAETPLAPFLMLWIELWDTL
jgi:hypothetical protein